MNSDSQSAERDQRQKLGRWGENLAADYLSANGYQVVARNWRTRHGEIDLIARVGETIAFVEVKTRRGREYGLPEEALTPAKAERLQKLAQAYLMDHNLHDVDWRIDLIAVELDQNGKLLRCEHIPNAVWGW